jgi:hypothetical protein
MQKIAAKGYNYKNQNIHQTSSRGHTELSPKKLSFPELESSCMPNRFTCSTPEWSYSIVEFTTIKIILRGTAQTLTEAFTKSNSLS